MKVHRLAYDRRFETVPVCNQRGSLYPDDSRSLKLTDNDAKVTCKNCLRWMATPDWPERIKQNSDDTGAALKDMANAPVSRSEHARTLRDTRPAAHHRPV